MQTFNEIPQEFTKIKTPPKQLFYSGNLSLLDKPKVAIVGARSMLNYTRMLVHELSSKLAHAGVVVVSGAALGVDAAAHRAAIKSTIAVMPTSLDQIYPKTNKEMIEQIYKEALAISEYPKGSRSNKYSFIERNRLVTALSDAVVIAQADSSSGSMHSARWAIEQGKELFVLPQRVGESNGTNALLASGDAQIIDNIDTFVERFGVLSEQIDDELLNWCSKNSDYEEAYRRFGEQLLEYELNGKIAIENAKVILL